MGHYVYKYVLNGEIIYIGLCDRDDLGSRLYEHGRPGDNIPEYGWNDIHRAEIYYTTLANKIMSNVVEKELIRRYCPKYNKAYKDSAWDGLPFPELIWHAFNKKDIKLTKQNKNTAARDKYQYLSEILEYHAIQNDSENTSKNFLCYLLNNIHNKFTRASELRYNVRTMQEADDLLKALKYKRFCDGSVEYRDIPVRLFRYKNNHVITVCISLRYGYSWADVRHECLLALDNMKVIDNIVNCINEAIPA